MKKKITNRIISGIITLVMLISLIPINCFTSVAVEGAQTDDQAEGSSNVVEIGKEGMTYMLGWGYNAITGADMGEIDNLKKNSWIDHNSKGLKLYAYGADHGGGVIKQYGESSYSTSSVEYLEKMGISFEQSSSANLKMGAVKAGVETKLGASFDMSTRQTQSEIYYRYVYKAICNNYSMSNNYGQYLSSDFLSAVEALGSNPSSLQLDYFFNTYGTHMLVSFDTGGEFELTSYAISNEKGNKFVSSITSSLEGNAGVGDESVSSKLSLGLNFETNSTESNAESHTTFFAIGGDTTHTGAIGDGGIDLDKLNIAKWTESLNGNASFLPSSSDWVPIWEVLSFNVNYNALCERLYNYFMEATKDDNNEFLKKYCSYSRRLTLGGYTYISPFRNDNIYEYVYQNVDLETIYNNGNQPYNPVAPGSKIIVSKTVDETLYSIDEITYEIAQSNGNITVDRNGVINVGTYANGSFELQMKYNDVTISTITFTIENEGYSGGYGTSSRPYLISTPADLVLLASTNKDQSKHFILTNDIDFTNYDPGSAFAGISEFSGTLDGNGYRIYGFKLIADKTDETADNSEKNSVGFIHVNTGTVKNLIIGKLNCQRFEGINKNIDKEESYSTYISATVQEKYAPRYSVGALVGWNEGVIDNCRVENTYVYGCNDETKDNDLSSFVYVGIVGTNNYIAETAESGKIISKGGIITRCVSDNNYFEAYATAKKNSGDNSHTYVGGIAGRSSGIISYCVSSNNTLRSDARGDGTDDNTAKPEAIAGGLVGRISNVHEKDSDYKEWKLETSYAYNNILSVRVTDTSYTKGSKSIGCIVGEAIAANEKRNPFSNVYACNTVNGTTYKDIGYKEDIYADGYGSYSKVEDLLSYVKGINIQYIKLTESDLVIPMPNQLIVSGGQKQYVENDFINPEDIQIKVAYELDSSLDYFKQYNILTNSYDSVTCNHFAINVPPMEKGIKTINITSFGGTTFDYNIEIEGKAVKEIIITRLPFNTNYYVGDELSANGLTVEVKYNNGEVVELKNGYTFKEYDKNELGKQTIIISYTEDGVTVTNSFTVTVFRIKPAYLELISPPEKTNYAIGEEFDSTGIAFTLGYNNGDEEPLSVEDVTLSGFSSNEEGNVEVIATYTYYDEDASKNATVSEIIHINIGTVVGIEINTVPQKLSYYTSDKKIITDGLSINVLYSNGAVKTIDNTNALKVSNYDLSVAGTHNVKVEYQGFADTFEIEVLPVTLSSIEIKKLPKTQYYIPDTLTTSGMVLTLNYVDGTKKDVYDGFITTVEGYDEGQLPKFMTTGSKTVTVSYEENGIRKHTSYDITISHRAIKEIQVVYAPLKQLYKQNEALNTEGLVVYGVYNNGDVFEIKDYTILPVDFSTIGTKTINIVYMGSYRTSFEVTVVAPERIYIAKMPDKFTYTIGDTFDPTGIIVKAVYWDYSEVILDQTDYTLSIPILDSYGSEKVTVTFGSFQTSFYVQIEEFEIPKDAPKIVVESTAATIGKTITVNICLRNNPGIASMKLNVEYDSNVLTLIDIAYNDGMGGMCQLPQDMTSPVILNWYNGWDDYIGDCVFATLTFKVSENALPHSNSEIRITYDTEDVYNILENNVTFYIEEASLYIIEYVPGDINDDGEVNNKDLTRLFQYLSGWEVEICEKALDINGDGNVNNKDMTRLFQYLSGWEVEIH